MTALRGMGQAMYVLAVLETTLLHHVRQLFNSCDETKSQNFRSDDFGSFVFSTLYKIKDAFIRADTGFPPCASAILKHRIGNNRMDRCLYEKPSHPLHDLYTYGDFGLLLPCICINQFRGKSFWGRGGHSQWMGNFKPELSTIQ